MQPVAPVPKHLPDLFWTRLKTPPLLVRFAPSLMYIATTNKVRCEDCPRMFLL